MTGVFSPDAVIRRVDGEGVLLVGGGRALLMQLAHPSVAAGVADHSTFDADPFARLRRTMEASYTIVFGSEEDARRTAAGIRAVHDRVTGSGYRASDPELLLWVHATLVDTALRVYQHFFGRLSADEAEEYYQQSCVLAEMLGCPCDVQPDDLDAFRDYVRTMVCTLEVTDTARELAMSVMRPKVPLPAEPLFAMGRQLTVSMLPRPLRQQYGFSWDRPRKAAMVSAAGAARRILPLVPRPLRRVPVTVSVA
jgi:uncharacterized protein (DUF2236 family)